MPPSEYNHHPSAHDTLTVGLPSVVVVVVVDSFPLGPSSRGVA